VLNPEWICGEILKRATGVEAARYFVSILVDSSFSQKTYEVFSALTIFFRCVGGD
jgi:hypothetical protein